MMDYSDMTIWQLKVERDKINAELELRTNVRASPSEAEQPSDSWPSIVKEYGPKIGFRYKDRREEYLFIGLVHAEDDYYYGLLSNDGKLHLATCVGALESMYEQLPNGGRCGHCNDVYPVSGQKKCDRYRCPQGDNPLSRSPHEGEKP
jgi:hypothetical protein